MIDWNQKITLTRKQLVDIVGAAFNAKPSKRVKSKSSFQTGVFNAYKQVSIILNKVLEKEENV